MTGVITRRGLTLNSFYHQHYRDSQDAQATYTTTLKNYLESIHFMLLVRLCQLSKNIIHVSNLTIKPEICPGSVVVIFGPKLAVTLTVPYSVTLVFSDQS